MEELREDLGNGKQAKTIKNNINSAKSECQNFEEAN
jgi:hypothetical protein